jgi:ribonuclease HI
VVVLQSTWFCRGRLEAWVGARTLQLVVVPKRSPPIIKEGIPVGWFDRAAQPHNQQSGVGGVIRIKEHTVVKWTLNCGLGTNNRVELLGVWALLTLASRFHIMDLQVFGDSRIIIDWLNKKGNLHVITLECWKDMTKELCKVFRTISFTHIYRDYNKQEDELSKIALQKQEGKIYYNLLVEGHEGPTLILNLL